MKKISIIFTLLFSAMIFAGAANAQTNKSEDDKVYKMSEVDVKPNVTDKPRAMTYGKCFGNGIAKVSAVLLKSGEVGKVAIVEASPCVTFNESALNAAKRIKFEPGKKDGEAVSVVIVLLYRYMMY